ncbi:MAG: ATPase [Acidimicrobiales bacterium]|nr:ATPase [Acidimicrobiales bacterium]
MVVADWLLGRGSGNPIHQGGSGTLARLMLKLRTERGAGPVDERLPTLARPRPANGYRARSVGAFDLRRIDIGASIFRWVAVLIGLALAVGDTHTEPSVLVVVGAGLVVHAAYRTFRPLRLVGPTQRVAGFVVDLAIVCVTLALTGRGDSPFLLATLPTMLMVGVGWGYAAGLTAAGAAVVTMGVAEMVGDTWPNSSQFAAEASVILVLTTLIGAVARRITLEGEDRKKRTADELGRMSTANDLLLSLHSVAQTLPASLDLGEVMASTKGRLRDLFDHDSATILVHDEPTGAWRVELAEGVRLPSTLADTDLPPLLREVADTRRTIVVRDLLSPPARGCAPLSRSALFAPLIARDAVVGLVAIEKAEPARYTEEDEALLAELVEPLALAVDNAMWFARLRTVGAEAERSRIARDLHDRLAQSLVYVGFELERIDQSQGGDTELGALRDIVRGVVSELRETLYQLRAIVSEEEALDAVAAGYVERFVQRTGIPVSFTSNSEGRRLPLRVEQELWRMLQEALTNVERHSQAQHASVSWQIVGNRAELEIRDDGRGFKVHQVARERFGLVGMGERADGIGAHLTIDSEPGAGTRVLVEVEVPND